MSELVEQQEMLRWENVPVLLCAILQELRVLNGKDKMPAPKQVVIEPRTETVQTAEPQTEKSGVSHDELKDLCLSLNRENPDNKGKIKDIIAKYTEGKLQDVLDKDLPSLKADIEQLRG